MAIIMVIAVFDRDFEESVPLRWHVGCMFEEHAEKNCIAKVSGRDAACIEKAY